MNVELLKSKIHLACVTDTNLHYEGSITIDRNLLEEVNMYEHEKVQVLNVNSGARINTYIMTGEPESSTICLNGAAARQFQPGDRIIVLSYASITEDKAREHSPKIIRLDSENTIQ